MPHQMPDAGAAAGTCAICLLLPAVVLGATVRVAQPTAGELGWLAELAGRCWRNRQYQSEICYWQSTPQRMHFLSRSGTRWLDCGVLVAADAEPGRIRSATWDDAGPSEQHDLRISGSELTLTEPQEPGSAQRAKVTVMTRPAHGRWLLFRQLPDGRTKVPDSTLRYRVGSAFNERDADARRCIAWERGDAETP
jgi:hypothetical protein